MVHKLDARFALKTLTLMEVSAPPVLKESLVMQDLGDLIIANNLNEGKFG